MPTPRRGGEAAPAEPEYALTVRTFRSTGTFTPPTLFKSPAGVVNQFAGQCWGGGAGGTTNTGGGGGGAYAAKPDCAGTPGVGISVTVPAAAAANANGGDVSIGAAVIAKGGLSGGNGGTGGQASASTGTTKFNGGAGTIAAGSVNGGGGAGEIEAGGTGAGTAAGGRRAGGFTIGAATGARVLGAGGGSQAAAQFAGARGEARVITREPASSGFARLVGYSTGRDTADATSRAAVMPANDDGSFEAGDLLVLIVVADGGPTITVAEAEAALAAAAQGSVTIRAFYLEATSATGDGFTIVTSASEQTCHVVLRFKDWTGPPEWATATGNSTNANPASLTYSGGVTKGSWWSILGFDISAFVDPVAPANFTGQIILQGASANGVMLAVSQLITEDVTVNPAAATSENEQWCAATLVVPGQVQPGGALSPNVAQIGDSITQGADGDGSSANDKGWREDLYDEVVAEDYNVEFVGTRNHGLFADNDHDGQPTKQIANRRILIADHYGAGKTFTAGRLFILMIGTNDVRQPDYSESASLAEYALLLGDMAAAWPNARILAMTIPAIDPAKDATASGRVAGLNTGIVAAWDAFDALHPSSTIIRVDANAIIGTTYATTHQDDGIHLTPAAYALLAPEIITAATPVLELA